MFWNENKDRLSEKTLELGCSTLGLDKKDIEIKITATPLTLNRFTRNSKGALYGWASRPKQINRLQMPQKSDVGGLYLCGHWATRGWGQGGVSMVANSGRTTAELALKSSCGKKQYSAG